MSKLNFPEHICIVGKTGSGKSMLLGDILRRNHDIYITDKLMKNARLLNTLVVAIGISTIFECMNLTKQHRAKY